MREVEPERSDEQLLENVLVLGLRQKAEHAAAIVVTDNERRADAVSLQRPESVHVVIKREVAEQDHRGDVVTGGRHPKACRHQTVDAACTPIRDETLLSFCQRPETVRRADGQARPDEDLARLWQASAPRLD